MLYPFFPYFLFLLVGEDKGRVFLFPLPLFGEKIKVVFSSFLSPFGGEDKGEGEGINIYKKFTLSLQNIYTDNVKLIMNKLL